MFKDSALIQYLVILSNQTEFGKVFTGFKVGTAIAPVIRAKLKQVFGKNGLTDNDALLHYHKYFTVDEEIGIYDIIPETEDATLVLPGVGSMTVTPANVSGAGMSDGKITAVDGGFVNDHFVRLYSRITPDVWEPVSDWVPLPAAPGVEFLGLPVGMYKLYYKDINGYGGVSIPYTIAVTGS